MAVVYVQEFPTGDRSTENYDFVAEKDGPFEGLIVHTAGFDDESGVFTCSGDPRPGRAVPRRTRPAPDRSGSGCVP